jgi:hypothetical protein
MADEQMFVYKRGLSSDKEQAYYPTLHQEKETCGLQQMYVSLGRTMGQWWLVTF